MKSGDLTSDVHVSRLSRCERYAFSGGHVFNDLCAAMWFTYLLVFLQRVAGFSHLHSGVLLFWGQLVDALCTPIIGYEADRLTCSCRYGKRKLWHAIGTICVLCSFPFVFTRAGIFSEAFSESYRVIYWCVFIAIFQFGWAGVQVAHLALIPQLTPVDAERVDLNAFRNAWTVLSNVIVNSLAWFLFSSSIDVQTVTENDFTKLMLSCLVIGIIFSLVFHIVVKESDGLEGSLTIENSGLLGRRVRWLDWLRDPQFYKIALIYTCSRLIVNVSQTYWPMYLIDTLKLAKQYIAAVPLVMSASGFFVNFFMRRFIVDVGRKIVFVVGLTATVLCCIWLWYLGENSSNYVVIPALLNGAVGSVLLVTSVSMTTDLIGINTDTSAFVFGVMSFTDKLSSGAVIALVQHFHPCRSGLQCTEAAIYYRFVMALLPASIATVCFSVICITDSARITRTHCIKT